MIFWNINELKRKINNNELTEFNYFIYFIMNCMTTLLWIAWPGSKSVTIIPNLILNALVLPSVCYSFHCSFQNKHFVEKYFALAFVSGIRVIVYIIVFSAVLLFFLYSIAFFIKFIFPDQSTALYESIKYFTIQQILEPTSTTSISFELFCILFSFWYVAKHYYDLCKQNALSVAG